MPAEHHLRVSMSLPRERERVFAFFAEASNLERITPPALRFHAVSPRPVIMQEGTRIEYHLRLYGWPFTWVTRIACWDPPRMFVDEQIAGPYREWIHTHRFHEREAATVIEDQVRYRLPLYPWGEAAYPLVRWQLQQIFAFRQRAIKEICMQTGFGEKGNQ
jgi:ligand-binding SRPBCC domain-containing protein